MADYYVDKANGNDTNRGIFSETFENALKKLLNQIAEWELG